MNVDLRATEVNTRQGLGYFIYPQATGAYWSVGGWAATGPNEFTDGRDARRVSRRGARFLTRRKE